VTEDREAQLTAERDQALAALWRIRMEAERWRTDEPAGPFVNRLIFIALTGMGENKRLAQELANRRPQ
jgi:hypothetical protein